nr:YndJ family transporter [Leptospira chreensis]
MIFYFMNENSLLLAVLTFGYGLAPFFTNRFFLKNSKIYSVFHFISFLLILLAIFFRIPKLTVVWPIFCGLGLVLFCKIQKTNFKQLQTWIGFLPFGFSLLSSLWFYCGQNECHLLGYNETWSYYAAIHGCFIGWLFLSGIISVSNHPEGSKKTLIESLGIVILFLLIALGIYGNPILKKIAVVGFSFLVPYTLWVATKEIRNQNRVSLILANCSRLFLCFTFLLALVHEFYIGFPKFIYGYPLMVILHGGINAFLVIPCFLFSLLFAKEEST